jgi:hypothetical protein
LENFASFGVVERSGHPLGRIPVGRVFRESAGEYVLQNMLRSGLIVSHYNAQFRDAARLHDRPISVMRECHRGVAPVARDGWTTWDVGERVFVAIGAASRTRPMIVLRAHRARR